jgi:hypothetical protein
LYRYFFYFFEGRKGKERRKQKKEVKGKKRRQRKQKYNPPSIYYLSRSPNAVSNKTHLERERERESPIVHLVVLFYLDGCL